MCFHHTANSSETAHSSVAEGLKMHKAGLYCLSYLHLHGEKAEGGPRPGHLTGEYRRFSFSEKETTMQLDGKMTPDLELLSTKV